MVSLGERADVDFGDLLDRLASDARTRSILLYIESIEAPRKFMSAARAAARNKPVIVVKAGRAGSGVKAAASHTGAMAGSDIVFDAAIRRAGMLRVDTLQDLFMAAETLARFGRNREGDIHLLRQYGEAYDFKVEEIPAEEIDHVKVSSTKVRQALQAGDVEHARQWLGYEYPITGLVVKGDQLGRTIGFPTANIALTDPYKLVPGDGVYAVRVSLRDGDFTGMLNIGIRPTVHSDGERTIEVHVLGLDRDLYGETITVRFSQRVRDEMKFDGVDALKEQLAKDRTHVMQLFTNT